LYIDSVELAKRSQKLLCSPAVDFPLWGSTRCRSITASADLPTLNAAAPDRPTGSALRDYVLFAGGVSGIILLALDAGPSREMIRKRSPAEAEAIQASADGAEPM
jgi:hypothetical protein